MKKDKWLRWIVSALISLLILSVAVSASAKKRHSLPDTSYYRGTRLAAHRKSENQAIPKRFRGTYYSWNYLRDRRERLVITKRGYHYSHRDGHGKWTAYERFTGKSLAVAKRRDGSVKLQLFKQAYSKQKHFFAKDYAVLKKSRGTIKLQVKPYRQNMISHQRTITFRKQVKSSPTRPQKITKGWFLNHRYSTAYYHYTDARYHFNVRASQQVHFAATSYWNKSSQNGLFYHSKSVKMVVFIPNKLDTSKANIIFVERLNPKSSKPQDIYYRLYARRISKNYIAALKGGQKKYKGHYLYSIPQLTGRRLVRFHE